MPRIRSLTNRPQPYGRGSLGAVPDHRTALLIELVQAAWFMQLSLAGSLQRPNRVASRVLDEYGFVLASIASEQ